MDEPARDGEIRDSQDRPVVDPAGAGRKNECLSREICHRVCRRRTMREAMTAKGMAEVSRGHSIRLLWRRRAEHTETRYHREAWDRQGPENRSGGLRFRWVR